MVFTSHIFLFYFLPLALLVYYALPIRFRNGFLTLASYLFYGWWMPWFVLLMMTSTIVDYSCARVISARGALQGHRLMAMITSIVVNLGLLAFFKYYMFAMENLNRLCELVGADAFHVVQVALPIGISLEDNIVKECHEEAGIPTALSSRAVPAGSISYCKQVPEGLKPDVQFVCDLELPSDFEPRAVDGEVEAFYLWSIDRVMDVVANTTEFKFNCNLVIIDFLVRHGFIAAEHQDYQQIVKGLR